MRDVILGFVLLQYGATVRYEVRPGAESAGWPAGESDPPLDHWIPLILRASDEERPGIVEQARAELEAWKRRPDPPPQGESMDELIDRVCEHAGWPAKEVALALRCTPTFVRRARLARDRHPDTGREEGSLQQARDLISQGYSLRQVAMLTGIPKSTLHEALDRAA